MLDKRHKAEELNTMDKIKSSSIIIKKGNCIMAYKKLRKPKPPKSSLVGSSSTMLEPIPQSVYGLPLGYFIKR